MARTIEMVRTKKGVWVMKDKKPALLDRITLKIIEKMFNFPKFAVFCCILTYDEIMSDQYLINELLSLIN